ncbi:MAG: helix-turn-helix domain-containing protein [Isosphaeraceae bacterium]
MIQKPFDRIEMEDVEALVANGVQESRTLEYKQALPANSDEEKREFLADVSSFANASGGDILYGIVEMRDQNGKTTGIAEKATGLAGANTDQEIRRLDGMIRDGVQPRITGVHIRSIDGFPDGSILLIRVQRSYAAPYMVTFKNLSRFYSRNSAGKYQLDVAEIRSAFALSESVPERIRRFRDERLARIVASETPASLHDGAKLVLHLLPLSALDPTSQLNIEQVAAQSTSLRPLRSSGYDMRYNFDGCLTYYVDSRSGICNSYVQFFRSGAIEAVSSQILINHDGGKTLPTGAIERELMEATNSYLSAYKKLQVEPPIIVMISLIGVRGYTIRAGAFRDSQGSIDRDNVLLPDLLIEDLPVPVETVLKPAFDAMWQASGWRKCFNYDDNGNRIDSSASLVTPC